MTEQEEAFIAAVASLLAGYGLPPMAGRMWGYLLICDPAEQTAAQIAEALHASRGSVSGTARMLTTAGFIRRGRRRGDRREYFSAPPDAFDDLLRDTARVYAVFRRTIEVGLDALADRPPAARERLRRLHEAFSFVEHEIPAMVERYLRERDADNSNLTTRRPAAESQRP